MTVGSHQRETKNDWKHGLIICRLVLEQQGNGTGVPRAPNAASNSLCGRTGEEYDSGDGALRVARPKRRGHPEKPRGINVTCRT